MERSTLLKRTSFGARSRPGAKLRIALMPAPTRASVTGCADSAGTAPKAGCRVRALGPPGEMAERQDGPAPGRLAELGWIVVEDGRDPEALAREALVVEEGGAEVAEADQRHLPPAVEAEDPLQLRFEPRDVVADAAHAELAEVGEALPHLRGVQA